MNRRLRAPSGVQLDMTPMIDVVFQLLAFFLMTFKVLALEGDFHVEMPQHRPGAFPSETAPALRLVMKATADGDLSSMSVAQRGFSNFGEFHEYVIGYLGDDRGPGAMQEAAELELDCDDNLRYENVIGAVTAASGRLDARGNVVRLIEKIKFSPPKGGP